MTDVIGQWVALGDLGALWVGDCVDMLRQLPDESVDSCVCDPPYELGFMQKSWDSTGIAYNVDLWREVLRVLKPGGHLLAFGGTRTSHRLACAIEDAGFDIRDAVQWWYGSGFPKSKDVSKAIDEHFGAERIVVGKLANPASTNRVGTMGRPEQSGSGWQNAPDLTAPGSPEAAAWEGWGTALKPAHEPIVVARKPLGTTVADCVLTHGTGGLNIAACRIGTDDTRSTASPTALGLVNDDAWQPQEVVAGSAAGRWPANVVLSHAEACVQVGEVEVARQVFSNVEAEYDRAGTVGEFGLGKQRAATATATEAIFACVPGCPVRELDSQSGTKAGTHGRKTGTRGTPGYKGIGGAPGPAITASPGGASRFFATFKGVGSCLICGTALDAGDRFSRIVLVENSAVSPVQDERTARSESSRSGVPPDTLPASTSATLNESVSGSASATPVIRPSGEKCSPECKPGETCPVHPASSAETPEPIGITTTTPNLWLCASCAGRVTCSSTSKNSAAGDQGLASSFRYVAKPSSAERDFGLGPEFAVATGGEATDREDGSAGLESPRAGAGRRGGRRNVHPTVKPVELMRYLVKLVTPPGGTVLDPFTGSGATGIAARLEGFRFLGAELGEEYARIAEARIMAAVRGEWPANGKPKGAKPLRKK